MPVTLNARYGWMTVTVSWAGIDIGVVSVVITGWVTGDVGGVGPSVVDGASVAVGAWGTGARVVGARVVGPTSSVVGGSAGATVVGDADATIVSGPSVAAVVVGGVAAWCAWVA
jgi:hypothetical protein